MARIENIALFDMDGTVCDYEAGLQESMGRIKSPSDEEINLMHNKNMPDYLKERRSLVLKSEEWWENLPKFKLGFDIWDLAGELEYRRMILTQAPRHNPQALSGKMKWIYKNLGEVDFTMTRDKGLVYGKVLVDDYPEYIERWLEWRPRGLAIMPASEFNKDYKHKQVIRYNGSNFDEVKEAMKNAKLRVE